MVNSDMNSKNKLFKCLFFSLCIVMFLLIDLNWLYNLVTIGFARYFKKFILLFDFSEFVMWSFLIVIGILNSFYMSKRYVIKASLFSIIYLLAAYFIFGTRQLNNPNFHWLDLVQNHFFPIKSIPILVFYFLVSLLSFKLLNGTINKYLSLVDSHKKFEPLFLGFWVSIILFSDTHVIDIYKTLTNGLTGLILANKLVLNYVPIFFICLAIVYVGDNTLKAIFHNRINVSTAVIFSLLSGILFNYCLQFGVRTKSPLMEMYIFPAATFYQILFITTASLFVYLIVNRFLLSTIVNFSFWGILSIVNILKVKMRKEPVLVTDLTWLKNPKLILSFIDKKDIFYIVIPLVLLVLAFIFLHKRILHGKITSNKIRLIFLTVMSVLCFSVYTVFKNEKNRVITDNIPIISQLNNNYNVFWMGSFTHATYRSLTFVWTKQLTMSYIEKPSNYSEKTIANLVKKYEKVAKDINSSRTDQIQNQTVIYILSESFADPSRINGVNESQNIIPNITNIMNSTTSGLMQSDGYGGGTANMEFQSLVGLPMYNLSVAVSILNTEIAPRMSFIPSISNAYDPSNRVVIHLGDADTYSRKNVYKKLGFAEFIADSNGDKNIHNFERLGLFPSDKDTYDTILNNITDNSNKFFSVITYQNHVPWKFDGSDGIELSSNLLNSDENESLNNYGKLLYQTDLSTQDFLNKLSTKKQNITVVFYGDHLPGFYPESIFSGQSDLQYKTDYFIWNNKRTKKLNYPLVNSSDFSAELLEQTDSKVSAYYALLTEVLKNSSVDKSDLTDKGKEVANDLKLVEYDLISGKGYLLNHKGFFKMPQ